MTTRDKRVLPAKLSAPRLPAIYTRPRLLRQIDSVRGRSLVWIEGQAGSGKTTLAADYIRSRRLNALWYRFDDRDADPAAFFYCMRQAVSRISPRRRETLPLLTAGYFAGLPVFARNFFEEVYARLKRPAVLVLDDLHELPVQSVLRGLLPKVIAAAPDGVTILALSRTAPTPEFEALRAGSRLSTIGGEDLDFRPREARKLARLRGATGLSSSALDAIQERTRGWAAGLVLTFEHARDGNITVEESPRVTREALFHYFATELIERAAPRERELLLKTSVLSQVRPSHAEALAEIHDAPGILADLVRRNFFTVRSDAALPVYQYHPLFREFLHARLRQTMTVEDYRGLCRRAAALIAGSGDVEEVGALLIAAQDHAGLAALALSQAEPLVRSGRFATLGGWLSHLPQTMIEDQPWIACWLALTEFPRDPPGALERMRRAMRIFRARGDEVGLGLAFSMHVDLSLVDFANFRGFDHSLAELVESITPQTRFPSREVELRIAGGMLVMLLWSRPWREQLEPWVLRATALVGETADPHLRLQVTHHLAFYHYWRGEHRRADEVVTAAIRNRDLNAIDPLLAAIWLVLDATHGWIVMDRERWQGAVERCLAIVEKHGLRPVLPQTLAQAVYGALSESDLAFAAPYLARVEAMTTPGVNLGTAHYRFLRGWEALLAGDPGRAVEELSRSAEISLQTGSPFTEALGRALLAQALCETGLAEEAERNLAIVDTVAARMESLLLRFLSRFARADEALRRGHADAETHLRDGLAAARAGSVLNFAGWRNDLMARVLAGALRLGIEQDYVTSLIRRRSLSPPPDAPDLEAWPWPVRIHTLGHFVAQRDGAPIAAKASGSARPLQLLKALIALGGRDVDEARLAEQLWPAAEGDRAHRSLKVNVHRLRRLLGEHSVAWSERRLSLDARSVWVDVWALESALDALESALAAQRIADLSALAARALALNRGSFLEGESSPWALTARAQLRAKSLRVVGAAAEALSARGRAADAVPCYEKALEIDPAAERFCQGLMRCHLDLGQRADGLAVYQRCRTALAREFRLAPSATTEALRAALIR